MKYGIWGGAFDPPHKEHIAIAKAAASELGLDKIVFLPESDAPHKDVTVGYSERREMLELALGGEDFAFIDDFEYETGGVGYTYVTLPALKKKYGDVVFIVGGDSMADFHLWKNPDQIVRIAPIAVCCGKRRRAEAEQTAEFYRQKGAEIIFLKYEPEDVSSSEIRLKKRLGYDISQYTGEKVADFIEKKGLYSEYSRFLDKLRADLPPDKYAHSRRTVLCAFVLDKGQTAYDKLFLAALLHDCAKFGGDSRDIPADAAGTPVAHAFCGAIKAKREYGVEDSEVLEAIYCHCTAKPAMSRLDKVVYCADMLESARRFPNVDKLRERAARDIDDGFLGCLESSYEHLKRTGAPIYSLTVEAYNYYFKGNKNRKNDVRKAGGIKEIQ